MMVDRKRRPVYDTNTYIHYPGVDLIIIDGEIYIQRPGYVLLTFPKLKIINCTDEILFLVSVNTADQESVITVILINKNTGSVIHKEVKVTEDDDIEFIFNSPYGIRVNNRLYHLTKGEKDVNCSNCKRTTRSRN